MSANESSPMNGDSLYNFASTGGWTLGKEQNGGAYFNKFRIVELTPEQVALVTQVAKSTYRPCCNNSTFFQDCNHGSRSEEHTSELQSLMRISYAVFCLKK